MQIEWQSDRLFALIRAPHEEITTLMAWLDLSSQQMNPLNQAPISPYICKEAGELLVLGGLIPVILKHNGTAMKPYECLTDLWRLRLAASTLVKAGLLRDYQAEASCAALEAPFGRAMLNMAMGSGKTHVVAGIAALAAHCDYPDWLYLVTNKELAKQTSEKLNTELPKMQEVLKLPAMPSVLAISYSGIEKLQRKAFSGLIVDEVHCVAAKTRALATAQIKALWRIGMSGTPLYRQDDKNILTLGLLGPEVYRKDIGTLIDKNQLASGYVKPVPFNHRQLHEI